MQKSKERRNMRKMNRNPAKPQFKDYTIYYDHETKKWKTVLRSRTASAKSMKSGSSGASSFEKKG